MSEIKKLLILIILVIIVIIFLTLVLLFPINEEAIPSGNRVTNIYTNTVTNNISNGINVNGTLVLDNNIGYEEKHTYEDEAESEISKLKYVENKVQYFTMKALYNNYIILAENKKTDELLDVISDEYIKEYGINNKNVIEKLGFKSKKDNQEYKPIIMEIMLAQIEANKKIYIIKGNCRITNSETKFPVNVIIEVDTKERKYEIYPNKYIEDKKYDQLKVEDTIVFTSNEIKSSENNQFIYLVKENYAVAKEHFEHYRELLLYYPDEAYKKLDQEYYESRFENIGLYIPLFEFDYENESEEAANQLLESVENKQITERKKNYDKYIITNAKRIRLMRFDEYIVKTTNDSTEYIVKDDLGNTTTYKIDSFLNYTVQLDGYILNYTSNDNIEGKILEIQNIINTKDYQELYFMRLNENFIDTNFKDISEFEKYMEENFYEVNEIIPINIREEDYYICECKLVNKLNKNQAKRITLIIGEDNMSFNLVN